MERQELLDMGFQELPHKTIGDSLIFPISRNRRFSINSLNTPNEMLFIYEMDENDPTQRKITNVIVLNNYDFDGYLTKDKMETLIKLIK